MPVVLADRKERIDHDGEHKVGLSRIQFRTTACAAGSGWLLGHLAAPGSYAHTAGDFQMRTLGEIRHLKLSCLAPVKSQEHMEGMFLGTVRG